MRKPKSESSYVLKVSLPGRPVTWRRIVMHGHQTLHDFHEEIFNAFDRYDEHLYSFYFPRPGARGRDRLRGAAEYSHPMAFTDPGPFYDDWKLDASKTSLDSLGLTPGQQFDYLFDFGDSWWHKIAVEEIVGPGVPTASGLIQSRGESPPQYPEDDPDD